MSSLWYKDDKRVSPPLQNSRFPKDDLPKLRNVIYTSLFFCVYLKHIHARPPTQLQEVFL